jgi:ribosomal-protein-alanine N-acetyltransferase
MLSLEGPRVALRDWRDEDASSLEPVCGDPEVCTFTSVPWTYTESAVREWIDRQRVRRADGSAVALAIADPALDRAIGNVNLVRFDEAARTAALGYWLLPAARGQGFATEASRVLCDWGFAKLNLTSIELAILPENAPSHRVAEKLGAARQGLRRDSHHAQGKTWDMMIYTLTPD